MLFGPNGCILAAGYPESRNSCYEYDIGIKKGNNVWIGGKLS